MAIRDKIFSHSVALLLDKLNGANKKCFGIDDAYALLSDYSQSNIKRMLINMVERGLIMRIKEGLYYIIPFEQDAETFMPDWHLLPQYLVNGTDYYIGYFSALQIHSLTTQPSLKEQVVVNRQIKPSVLPIKDIPFQFIYHNEKHFFGNKKTWIDSYNRVQCSDLEKTIIDCLFKPDYAGGVTEITKAIYKVKDKIDYMKLLEYAKCFASQAVIKRLGFLLELLEIKNQLIDELQKLRTGSFVALEPSYPKEGKSNFRWAIIQNIDKESVISPIYS
jgi:predicted transcriptional regulator of viral defense system